MGKKNTNKASEATQKYDWDMRDDGRNAEFVAEGVRFAFTGNGKKLLEPETFKKSTKFKGLFIVEEENEAVDGMIREMIQTLVRKNVPDMEDWEFPDDFDGEIDGVDYCFYKVGDDNTPKGSDDTYDGFADNMYISATRPEKQGAPAVFADTEEEITEFPDARLMRDGCYGNLAGRAYVMDSDGEILICCTIEAVIYTSEGEPFTADQSYAKNDDKKKKLFGSHKAKENKAKKAFGKKKKKSDKED